MMLSEQDVSRNVLALGMGYIRLDDREKAVRADCPYFRDVKRLKKFEELGYHVHSVNMQVCICVGDGSGTSNR